MESDAMSMNGILSFIIVLDIQENTFSARQQKLNLLKGEKYYFRNRFFCFHLLIVRGINKVYNKASVPYFQFLELPFI